MDWKFWSTLAVNIVGVGIMLRQLHVMKPQIAELPSPRSAARLTLEKKLLKKFYIPVFIMVGLVLLSWLPYVLQGSRDDVLPIMSVAWGGSDKGCNDVIDTSGLQKAEDKYRLFVACTISDPTVDALEDKNFAISKPFHLNGSLVPIAVMYDAGSAIASVAKPGTMTNHSIILLPKDQDGSRITKLSDVLRDGGKILTPGAKKPF